MNQPEMTKARREPVGLVEWDRLLNAAIARAEKVNDRRSIALKAAQASGRPAEMASILKRYGIICEADIQREFP